MTTEAIEVANTVTEVLDDVSLITHMGSAINNAIDVSMLADKSPTMNDLNAIIVSDILVEILDLPQTPLMTSNVDQEAKYSLTEESLKNIAISAWNAVAVVINKITKAFFNYSIKLATKVAHIKLLSKRIIKKANALKVDGVTPKEKVFTNKGICKSFSGISSLYANDTLTPDTVVKAVSKENMTIALIPTAKINVKKLSQAVGSGTSPIETLYSAFDREKDSWLDKFITKERIPLRDGQNANKDNARVISVYGNKGLVQYQLMRKLRPGEDDKLIEATGNDMVVSDVGITRFRINTKRISQVELISLDDVKSIAALVIKGLDYTESSNKAVAKTLSKVNKDIERLINSYTNPGLLTKLAKSVKGETARTSSNNPVEKQYLALLSKSATNLSSAKSQVSIMGLRNLLAGLRYLKIMIDQYTPQEQTKEVKGIKNPLNAN